METGSYPTQWSRGIIRPIHKSGSKNDPSNYRGITLLNIAGKLFTSILNQRLLDWAESTNLINEAQFGFRQGRRTTDAIFILTTAVHLHRKARKPLYACFVDFKKAFDSINHQLLWQKLTKAGISPRILAVLKSMYSNATAVVKLESSVSTPFPCRRGVRQGCNLSPLLFSLFISDLEDTLNPSGAEGVDLGNAKLRLLLFADDLVIVAHSPEDLQTSLDKLSEYCAKWDLLTNSSKTKVIATPFARATPFQLNNEAVELVSTYKYLGVIINTSGSLKPAITTLIAQAKKAIFAIIKKSKSLHHPNPSILLHLFDSLVRPILEYGCEVWSHAVKDEVELLHRSFCKFILGVPSSATNAACYGELGRIPLHIRREIAAVKYWIRLSTHWNAPKLLVEAYHANIVSNLSPWAKSIKVTLDKSGLSYIWQDPLSAAQDPTGFLSELQLRLSDQYTQRWHGDLSTSRKLRTYRLFKSEFKLEPYLSLPRHLRAPLTRLRTSTHSLMIEIGRYHTPSPLPIEDRLCPACNKVEDEAHFLLACKSHDRSDLIKCCSNINKVFPLLSQCDQLNFILSSSDPQITHAVAKYSSQNLRKSS